MSGINALSAEQLNARRVLLVMNSLGRMLRNHGSYHLREGLPQHFAELSHWAWRGDADGALSAEIDASARSIQLAPSTAPSIRRLPEYHRYTGLVMVRDLCRTYTAD
jgi:hypothetical protein